MDKPIPPGDGECCESGCSPCVWDRYYEALRAWEAQQASLKPKMADERLPAATDA